MKQMRKLNQLNEVGMFNRETLQRVLFVSKETAYGDIKRWIKNGTIVQLKRGRYVTRDYFLLNRGQESYQEWIANKLKEPSYLSSEYVLQKHSILSEAVFGFTSVTLKKTDKYDNKLGGFIYTKIKPELFVGYEIKRKGIYEIKEASQAKALFDYLYYQVGRVDKITPLLWEDMRMNMEEITDEVRQEFNTYCEISGSKKMKEIGRIL